MESGMVKMVVFNSSSTAQLVDTKFALAEKLVKDNNIDVTNWRQLQLKLFPLLEYYSKKENASIVDPAYNKFFDPWDNSLQLRYDYQKININYSREEIAEINRAMDKMSSWELTQDMSSVRSDDWFESNGLSAALDTYCESPLRECGIPVTVEDWLDLYLKEESARLKHAEYILGSSIDSLVSEFSFTQIDLEELIQQFILSDKKVLEDAASEIMNIKCSFSKRFFRAYLAVMCFITERLQNGVSEQYWKQIVKNCKISLGVR